MSRYLYCFHKVLGHEGGFVDHKRDKGGRTNYGVTQKTYDDFCRRENRALGDVRDITMSEVEAIYYQYWRAAQCDTLPEPLDYFVFDCAINSGAVRAIKLLQRALGIRADGQFGPQTQHALELVIASSDNDELAREYLRQRAVWYDEIIESDPTQAVFAKGWINRLDKLHTELA